MCDDVHIELEALEATYDGAVTVSPGLPVVATVSLAPRGCPLMMPTDPADASTEGGEESLAHAEARCFVRATLLLACDAAYPQHPPDIKLQQPRGLGEAREAELVRRLRDEAADLAGELVLGHLCEAAQDILTEMNSPDGSCPICLLPLAVAGGSPQGSPDAADQPVKLQCYHCMHRQCFGGWWRWRQSDAVKRSSVQCPVCRAPVAAVALAPSLSMQSQAAAEAGRSNSAGAGYVGGDGADDSWLPADEMARLRVSQRRWAEGIEQQRRRDGLVKAGGWGVSIDDLQQLQQDTQRAAQAATAALPGEAASASGRTSSSPASSAGRTSSASRGRSRGHDCRGVHEHGSSRSDWRPQRGKGESHGLPAGRVRRSRQAGAREGVAGSKHAERPADSPAPHERMHRDGGSDGATQEVQRSRPKPFPPAREAERSVQRPAL